MPPLLVICIAGPAPCQPRCDVTTPQHPPCRENPVPFPVSVDGLFYLGLWCRVFFWGGVVVTPDVDNCHPLGKGIFLVHNPVTPTSGKSWGRDPVTISIAKDGTCRERSTVPAFPAVGGCLPRGSAPDVPHFGVSTSTSAGATNTCWPYAA